MVETQIMTWTDERVARLKELWAAGWSASQIAKELGFDTRNAVCGKIDRLGLYRIKRGEPVNVPRAPRRAVTNFGPQVQAIRRLNGPKLSNDDFKPRLADVVSRRVTILEVCAMECRWADEDRNGDGLHTFCGNPTADGASYCSAHAELSRGYGTASERAVAPFQKREAA